MLLVGCVAFFQRLPRVLLVLLFYSSRPHQSVALSSFSHFILSSCIVSVVQWVGQGHICSGLNRLYAAAGHEHVHKLTLSLFAILQSPLSCLRHRPCSTARLLRHRALSDTMHCVVFCFGLQLFRIRLLPVPLLQPPNTFHCFVFCGSYNN